MSSLEGIEVRGFDEAMKTLEPGRMNGPIKDFLFAAGRTVKQRTRAAAPVRRGTLRSSIRVTMSRVVPPKWATVGTSLTRGGFPYPAVLEGSARYHFGGGSKPTKGWFSGAAASASSTLDRLRRTMEARIFKKFEA